MNKQHWTIIIIIVHLGVGEKHLIYPYRCIIKYSRLSWEMVGDIYGLTLLIRRTKLDFIGLNLIKTLNRTTSFILFNSLKNRADWDWEVNNEIIWSAEPYWITEWYLMSSDFLRFESISVQDWVFSLYKFGRPHA